MKRIVVACVVVFALIFALNAVSEAQVKITMWSLFSGGEGYIMTNLLQRFNQEHPDIEIEEQLIEWGQYYNKLLTGLLSGEAPDVGIMHLAVLPDYASRGVLSPIGDGVEAGFTDKFLPNIIEKAYYDGELLWGASARFTLALLEALGLKAVSPKG